MNPNDKQWKEKKLNHHDNKILFDNNTEHFVMGDWEEPVMKAHAEITCRNGGHILEVGFGMGISANYIQEQDIKSHTIIELNDEVYKKAVEWAKDKPNTKIIHGDWKTVELNEKFDAIFYDAGEQQPHDTIALSLLPLYILRFCRVGTLITIFNHMWHPTTIWHKRFFNEGQIKFYEIDGRVPEGRENGYNYQHDTYYLPEWIITEDDTEEKYRKCITR